MRSNFKTIIILNIIVASLSTLIGLIPISMLSIGNAVIFWWLNSKDDYQLAMNKNTVLVFGILDFLSFKIVSGALCISVYSQMKRYTYQCYQNGGISPNTYIPPKPKVDPQIKKIDILLKLGVAMVFIAGFVFATTGWNSLNSILKIFIFLLVSTLFIGLSKFCEKKIKIKSTVYLYWILGMAFIMFMLFNAGYDSLFGYFFSFNGDGRLLYWSFTMFSFAIVGLVTYFNFKNKSFLYILYSGITLSIVFVLNHLSLINEQILLILLPIVTIFNVSRFNKEKDIYTLYKFSNILLICLSIIFVLLTFSYSNLPLVILLSILYIFNIYYYGYCNKESSLNNFAPLLAYFAILPIFNLIDSNVTVVTIATSLFMTILYLIAPFINSKKLTKSSLIFGNVLIIISFLMSLAGSVWLPLVIVLFTILIYIINIFVDKENSVIELSIQPIKVSMLLFSLLYLVESYFNTDVIMQYWIVLTSLVFILTYCLCDKERNINIYECYSIGAIAISLLSVPSFSNLLLSVVTFLSTIVFYIEFNGKYNKSSSYKGFVFSLLLFNILTGMNGITSTLIERYFASGIDVALVSNTISLILFILIGWFYKNDKIKSYITLFAISIPIVSIGATVDIDWISMILPSSFIYYITFVICKLVKSDTSKDVTGYIGYSLAFLLVIFNSNYYVLGYSCLILFISILIGYLSKKYNALFRVSVISLIIFILYRLKDIWTQVPIWLYLLIFGIALISISILAPVSIYLLIYIE